MAEKYGKKVREMMVSEMKDIFSENKGFIISSMKSVKATDIDTLRKKVRQSGSRYLVVKNRLAAIAFEESGIKGLSAGTAEEKTMIGISIINDDPAKIAKLMMEFSKANSGFALKSGYLEGTVLSADRVKELSNLPSRQQLVAMLAGTLNAPVSNFAGVLSSVVRSVLYALNAVKDKKEKEGK